MHNMQVSSFSSVHINRLPVLTITISNSNKLLPTDIVSNVKGMTWRDKILLVGVECV